MIATSSPAWTASDTPRSASDLVVPYVVEAKQIAGIEDRIQRVHANESVTIFQGSTLSEPRGAWSVSTASFPPRQNS